MEAILRAYSPRSWFHPRGIHRVVKALEPRLPDVGGSLFLTFTLDPAHFDGDAEAAFENGRDHLRRVFHRLRQGETWQGRRYAVDGAYCVKVEFHRNGWAHFHVIFLTRRYVPNDLLRKLWGRGITHVRRISDAKFRYLLKYVTKGGELPDWIRARSRLRVFQSSSGFLKPAETAEATGPEPQPRKRTQVATIGERLERWARLAVLETPALGVRRTLELGGRWRERFDSLVHDVARDGRYLGNGRIRISTTGDLFPWLNPIHPAHPSI